MEQRAEKSEELSETNGDGGNVVTWGPCVPLPQESAFAHRNLENCYMGDAKSLLFDVNTVQGLIAHHSAPRGTLKCVCNYPL